MRQDRAGLCSHDDRSSASSISSGLSCPYHISEGKGNRRDAELQPELQPGSYRDDTVASITSRPRRVVLDLERSLGPWTHSEEPGLRPSFLVFDINAGYRRAPPHVFTGCPGLQDSLGAEAWIRAIWPDSLGMRGVPGAPARPILAVAVANDSTLRVTAQCRASFGIIPSSWFLVDFRNRGLLLALRIRHLRRPRARRRTVHERAQNPQGCVNRLLPGCIWQHHRKTTQGAA